MEIKDAWAIVRRYLRRRPEAAVLFLLLLLYAPLRTAFDDDTPFESKVFIIYLVIILPPLATFVWHLLTPSNQGASWIARVFQTVVALTLMMPLVAAAWWAGCTTWTTQIDNQNRTSTLRETSQVCSPIFQAIAGIKFRAPVESTLIEPKQIEIVPAPEGISEPEPHTEAIPPASMKTPFDRCVSEAHARGSESAMLRCLDKIRASPSSRAAG